MTSEQLGHAEALLRSLTCHLHLERPLAAIDVEATGPYPDRDRIVEFAVLKVLPTLEVRRFESFINPGEPIPCEATAVHGITDAMVADAPTWDVLGPRVHAGLQGCDVLAYNPRRFDRRILVAECGRIGLGDPLEGARILDPFVIFQREHPRDLSAAVRVYCGDTFEAHRAMDDVVATIRVAHEQLLREHGELPRTIDALHDYCLHRDPSFVDAEGKIVWRNGEAVLNFGKNAGRSLRELAAYDAGALFWILNRDFPADTRAIVEAALHGDFPVPPSAPAAPALTEAE